MIRAFLDANVLVAAAASANGGSAIVLEGCRKRRFWGIVSRLVLLEAERNIRKKLSAGALRQHHLHLETIAFDFALPHSDEEIRGYSSIIDAGDAPILAAAVASRCTHIVTLDRRHFFTEKIQSAKLPLKIFTPRDLLTQTLPWPKANG